MRFSSHKVATVINEVVPINSDGVPPANSGDPSDPQVLAWRNFSGYIDTSNPYPNRIPQWIKTHGPLSMPQTVTFTLGSPGIVNLSSHGFRPNEAVVFQTTGVLPTGLVPGTIYYVRFAGMTADIFQVTATDAFPQSVGDQAAVNFTGSQSGTHSVRAFTEWTRVVLQPGAYNNNPVPLVTGARRVIADAYGASINQGGLIGTWQALQCSDGGLYWTFPIGYAPAASLNGIAHGAGSENIALANPADAAHFYVGGWVAVASVDLQNSFGNFQSWPANPHNTEYTKVTAINLGTGTLTVSPALRYAHDPKMPSFVANGFNGTNNAYGGLGAKAVVPIGNEWDCDQITRGMHYTASSQYGVSARRATFIDCIFEGQGPAPGSSRDIIFENCTFHGSMEIDKMLEFVSWRHCYFDNNGGPYFSSSSVDRAVMDGCTAGGMGTARITHIRDSLLGLVNIGVQGQGSSEMLLIENCRIGYLQEFLGAQFTLFNGAVSNSVLLNNFTFSGGTFSQPMDLTVANFFIVPGKRMFINDFKNNFDTMGAPFIVYNIYQKDAATATVTISIANPAVVTYTSHGLTANTIVYFKTTGALPTGMIRTCPYRVSATGLTTNTFQLIHVVGGNTNQTPGATVVTSGTQSGTHTIGVSPMYCFDTDLPTLPTGNQKVGTVTISIASPAVITWNSHGLTSDTPVLFRTTPYTGALPTGLNTPDQLYYVLATGLTTNTFQVATSPGGTAVNTSGTQSGTQTAIANPLKLIPAVLQRITVRNSTGCPEIVQLSESPPDQPPWTYGRKRYVGQTGTVNNNMGYLAIRGYLKQLTIDVRKAFTGTGTWIFTVSAPAFDTSLNRADLSQAVNAAIAGKRVITPAGTTGGQTGDTISAFGNWIGAGMMNQTNAGVLGGVSTGTGVGWGMANAPDIVIEVMTTQGGHDCALQAAGVNININAGTDLWFDSGSVHGGWDL